MAEAIDQDASTTGNTPHDQVYFQARREGNDAPTELMRNGARALINQADRVDVCHGKAAYGQNQELRLQNHDFYDSTEQPLNFSL